MRIDKLGPYRIGKKIGKGGMGAVYEAQEDATGKRVAVKVLNPQLALAEGFRDRFESEIESLKKLRHEGIVRLFGYGQQDGILFFSMELVDGTSLEEEIRAGRRFDWRETMDLGIQVCHALKHAHDHGIVHRDIKPANLLMAEGDHIKIADFGIARFFGGTQMTNVGGVLGTADYMSPEQADGRSVTEKCDQYSLGGVMVALLSGRPPFRAKTMPEMLQLHRFAEPESVRVVAPDTPIELDRLVMQLLAKEPDDRFPNVLALGRHMEAMRKALSRPVPIDPKQRTQDVTGPRHATSPADRTDHPEESSSPAIPIHPLMMNDASGLPSQIFDAPTVADSQSDNSAPMAPPDSQVEEEATEQSVQESRFTTIEQEVTHQQQNRGDRIQLALQLAGLSATLLLLVWGGWWLMRPPTADDLYAQIMASLEEHGPSNLRQVADPIDDFIQRFADDPRAKQLEPYREELVIQQMERRLKYNSRTSGPGWNDADAMTPVELLFRQALSRSEEDPQPGIAMLQSLLALYDPENRIGSDLLSSSRDKTADVSHWNPSRSSRPEAPPEAYRLSKKDSRWLILARRRLTQLIKRVDLENAKLLSEIRIRMTMAAQYHQTNPDAARQMLQAIIDLYGERAWAEEIVGEARSQLAELQ